jgi:hypothetical protein
MLYSVPGSPPSDRSGDRRAAAADCPTPSSPSGSWRLSRHINQLVQEALPGDFGIAAEMIH